MDSNTFDALTRGFAARGSRRTALGALVAGVAGIGAARSASAGPGAERATCRNRCDTDRDCNAGYRCGDRECFAIPSSRTNCVRNTDCTRNFEVCDNSNGKCVSVITDCPECDVRADCPDNARCDAGKCVVCRDSNDCPSGEVCKRNACVTRECSSNGDCPNRRRCKGGLCVRKN